MIKFLIEKEFKQLLRNFDTGIFHAYKAGNSLCS